GPDLRPRLDEREVDVEEDGGGRSYTVAGHRYAPGRRLASDGNRSRTSSSRARSSSAVITDASSGASATTSPQGSATSDRPNDGGLSGSVLPICAAAAT